MATAKDKKKIKIKVYKGHVYIKNTFNNTIVTITDPKGNAICSSSAGSLNFKGTRKSTPYASQVVAETVMEEAMKYGLKEVDIFVKGPGYGRESAIRAVTKSGIKVNFIKDITGIPHNGCRPKKERRV